MAKVQKITPFLWFNENAEEAANFYTSVFKKSKIVGTMPGFGGRVMVVSFELAGQRFTALNGGPMHQINPSISFFVTCRSVAECKSLWKQLSKGGQVFMPLGEYPWSIQYGWIQDKFGVSWQIISDKDRSMGKQKFVPNLMFTGPLAGKGEAAMQFYTSIFPKSEVQRLSHYKAGGAGPVGQLEYGQFLLVGQPFTAMDNPQPEAKYGFTEGLSFVVNCKNQKEVDYYWDALLADGGTPSQCAWLKDKFGVSWQIVPEALPKLLADPDPAVAQKAMANMLRMQKINIRKLKSEPKKVNLTVKTTVNAPVERAWKCYTTPADIMVWNHAGDDWHCPKATNDLRVGGKFSSTMAAKDGSVSFDFTGKYTEVIENQRIGYLMDDGRPAKVTFKAKGKKTEVTTVFEAENMHPLEMQVHGWQAILNNYKAHTEAHG